MTEQLPDLEVFIKGRQQNLIAYEVEEGQCLGAGLWKNERVSVQLCTLSKGTVFPMHHHQLPVVVEWLHIYVGSVKVEYEDGSEEIIEQHGSVSFETNKNHKVTALDNVELIAVAMPSDKSYPDGR